MIANKKLAKVVAYYRNIVIGSLEYHVGVFQRGGGEGAKWPTMPQKWYR